jgi:hypothetical protein
MQLPSSIPQIFSYRELKQYIAKHPHILLKLSIPGCKPCQRIQPCFYKLQDKARQLKFLEMPNYDESFWNYKRFPTFVYVKMGVPQESITTSKEETLQDFVDLINKSVQRK